MNYFKNQAGIFEKIREKEIIHQEIEDRIQLAENTIKTIENDIEAPEAEENIQILKEEIKRLKEQFSFVQREILDLTSQYDTDNTNALEQIQ